MTEDEMKLAGIYRDKNGKYHACRRSKEDQETIDAFKRLFHKAKQELDNLFENPTQEDEESFLTFLGKQKRNENG